MASDSFKNKTAGKSNAVASRLTAKMEAITSAAIVSIRKNGAAQLSVDDLAVAAGVSRRTFYRFFDGRSAIMETILLMRMRESAIRVKAALKCCKSFEEEIIVGTIEALRLLREDKVYRSIAESESHLMLEIETNVRSKSLEQIFLGIWGEVFDRAREAGHLRQNVSNKEAADWLIGIHDMLRQRDEVLADPKDVHKTRLLKKFALPSLMRDQ
jgi:AcrR family transcriptional regulator